MQQVGIRSTLCTIENLLELAESTGNGGNNELEDLKASDTNLGNGAETEAADVKIYEEYNISTLHRTVCCCTHTGGDSAWFEGSRQLPSQKIPKQSSGHDVSEEDL